MSSKIQSTFEWNETILQRVRALGTTYPMYLANAVTYWVLAWTIPFAILGSVHGHYPWTSRGASTLALAGGFAFAFRLLAELFPRRVRLGEEYLILISQFTTMRWKIEEIASVAADRACAHAFRVTITFAKIPSRRVSIGIASDKVEEMLTRVNRAKQANLAEALPFEARVLGGKWKNVSTGHHSFSVISFIIKVGGVAVFALGCIFLSALFFPGEASRAARLGALGALCCLYGAVLIANKRILIWWSRR